MFQIHFLLLDLSFYLTCYNHHWDVGTVHKGQACTSLSHMNYTYTSYTIKAITMQIYASLKYWFSLV